jgi:hypothetical protein
MVWALEEGVRESAANQRGTLEPSCIDDDVHVDGLRLVFACLRLDDPAARLSRINPKDACAVSNVAGFGFLYIELECGHELVR